MIAFNRRPDGGIKYFDNPSFHDDNVNSILSYDLYKDPHGIAPTTRTYKLDIDGLIDICRLSEQHGVLSKNAEISLFQKYNCLKCLADKHYRLSDIDLSNHSLLRGYLNNISTANTYLAKAAEVRNLILIHNTRIILKVIINYAVNKKNLSELYSECCWVMLRLIDHFNPNLGFKFSTYMYNSLILAIKQWLCKSQKESPVDSNDDMQLSNEDHVAELELKDSISHIRQLIEEVLSTDEKMIITRRYGLDGYEPCTLQELGKYMHVTKERIRQIQNQALLKLHHAFY